MDIKYIIENKNVIFSIKNKIDLFKKKQNAEKYCVMHPIIEGIGSLFAILFEIGLAFGIGYLLNFIIDDIGTVFFLSIFGALFLPIISYFTYLKFKEKTIKKELKKKPKYFFKIFNNLNEFIVLDAKKEDFYEFFNTFNQEEIDFINQNENNNLIYIKNNEFKKNIYSYVKNNKISKEEYSDIINISHKFNINLDKEKLDSFYELSTLKHSITIKENLIIKNI